MGYDYRKKLKAEGQLHSNACWVASLSWWISAMAQTGKRTPYDQTTLLADFQEHVSLGGGVRASGIRKIMESAKIRMDLTFISPAKLKTYNFCDACVIIFNYPSAGGTHNISPLY